MQSLERSTRTRFKPDERSSLTSSPPFQATFPHAHPGGTIGGPTLARLMQLSTRSAYEKNSSLLDVPWPHFWQVSRFQLLEIVVLR